MSITRRRITAISVEGIGVSVYGVAGSQILLVGMLYQLADQGECNGKDRHYLEGKFLVARMTDEIGLR